MPTPEQNPQPVAAEAVVPDRQPTAEGPGPSRALIAVLALACGVGVSSLYFPQAITPLIASHFQVGEGAAALVATLAQFGYATGIFFLLPLGDRLPRRPLVATMFTLVSLFLLLAALTPSLSVLYLASAAVGIATVVPQVLIPMSADLAGPGQAGRVVGSLSAGLIGGILLSRAFGGFLGEWLGWRSPYFIASALTLVLAVVLAIVVPATESTVQHRYPALLATSARLFLSQPDLRRSSLYQFMMFGGFSAAWTSVALYLTGSHFGYGTAVIGVVALVGAGGVFAAPIAGRAIDRLGPDAVNLTCFLGMLLSAGVLLAGLAHGVAGVIGISAGLLLMDSCVQCSQISNQSRIFTLVPGARSRLNSVYMTSVFLGGSAGSWVGARCYASFGWAAVCVLVAGAALVALARHAVHWKASRGAPVDI